MKLKFELTNEQRKYLGLIPVEEDWELVKLNYKYEDIYFYFDEDTIRKKISLGENSYYVAELNEKTAENRTVILPKTARGKIKKFNFTAIQSFSPFGTYFSFSKNGVLIANYTTQRTYYSESFMKNKNITINDLKKWLDKWIKESTGEDLKECIKEKSNSPYWEREIEHRVYDLRNPCLIELKRKIFKTFGLDADKTYEENLKIMGGE